MNHKAWVAKAVKQPVVLETADPGPSAAEGRMLMPLPRAVFLRSIMVDHWSHHRSRLGVYRRLLGAAVPSSDGPSADESRFQATARELKPKEKRL